MARILMAIVLVASMMVIGATVGGVLSAMLGRSLMGYDELASLLAGLMGGAAVGLITALIIVRRSGEPRLKTIVAAAALVAIAIVAYVFLKIASQS